MQELLADFGGHIGQARACITDPARIVYRPVASLLLPPPWFKGRVLVIGDAAHTCAPQLASGATIAIEDSIVLADLIQSGQPIEEVLEQFMARRYERAGWWSTTHGSSANGRKLPARHEPIRPH